jgi:hypothetical protein
MNATLSRMIAALLSGALIALLSELGVPLTDTDVSSLTQWVEQGVTLLGWGVGLAAYGVLHKLLDRRINPSDAAR